MNKQAIVLAALVVLSGAPVTRADDLSSTAAAALDGTWIATKDADDSDLRVLRFEYGARSVTLLFREPDGVTYARGSGYPQPAADGRIGLVMRSWTQMITNLPEFEDGDEAYEVEMALTGPDSGELWMKNPEGVLQRWGTIARSPCDLQLVWRDRSDTPPDACTWLELRGVGFNGLDGECEYSEEWEADWENITHLPNGDLTPSACLITAPAVFER